MLVLCLHRGYTYIHEMLIRKNVYKFGNVLESQAMQECEVLC